MTTEDTDSTYFGRRRLQSPLRTFRPRDLHVSTEEISRYLKTGTRTPNGELLSRIEDLNAKSASAIRPVCAWRRFPISAGAISSGGISLPLNGSLGRHLSDCSSAYLLCGTIGPGFDALQRRVSAVSPADAFILQAIGAALVERLMDESEISIGNELAPCESLVSRYSPGYGDFPLAAQRDILALLDAARSAGVSVTESLLMAPSKSVCAIAGVKESRNTFQ